MLPAVHGNKFGSLCLIIYLLVAVKLDTVLMCRLKNDIFNVQEKQTIQENK